MRKLFFLIPAMLLSLAINATIHEIGPGDPETVVNDLLVAKLQSSAVVDGDVIELKDGIYSEYSNYLFFNKSVEVRATEGAHPIVEVECYIKIGESAPGKNITIRGIKFDASKQDATGNQSSSYSHFIRVYSAGTLDFENCEFYGCKNQVIEVESSNSVENLIVNNCYFRDITNTCIYVQNTSESNLTITNSTFANIDATGVSAGIIDTKAATGTVVVDHCTFYDCKAKNTDYGVIGHNGSFTSDFTVSNSIFAWGTMYDKRATYLPSGTAVSNCLTYNTNKDTDKWGHHSGPTFSNCMLQDPLFNDLANNKYTYAGTYGVSMSPARGAATDGSDLGDPRWYTPVTYPSTDFASGYVLNGGIAELTGNIEYNTLKSENEADHYLRYYDRSVNGTAIWKIHATRSCYVQATLNMFDNSWNYAEDPAERKSYKNGGHIFAVQLLDMNSNPIDGSVAVAEPSESDAIGDILVPGFIFIPAEGDYIIQLSNSRGYSKCGIYGVTLTYAGGDFVTIPSADPIPFADAILSEKATRSLSPAEIHFGSPNAAQYAQWNAHASAGLYDITFTFTGTNHGIYQLIIKQGNNTIFSDTKGQGGSGSVSFESVMIPANGDYVIQVANINPGADGYLTSVTAAAAALADAWIIDDEATTEDDIEAHDGVKYIPILKRSFVAGMYNTICVPFDSYDSELTSIFGAGYELLALESATLTDGVLVLNFQTVAGNSFAAGTPYLIKPTQDVVNPQFSKHTIHMYASNHVQHGGAADFIGTYIQKQLDADYDLFLGQNNILHFPSSTSAPLKGLRAYFHVTAASAQAIKRARIVTQEQVITEIDLVNGENQGLIKTIENGQLIINLDGIRYNIMGGKIK